MAERAPTTDQIREFVIAGHGNLEKVREMLSAQPSLLNAAYQWKENDIETAIQGAAQLGNRAIAEYLLKNGAPLDMCTATMLGRMDEVRRMLAENPDNIHATGAHGIPLLTHAAWSGNLELIQLLFERGAREGVTSALHNAVRRGYYDIVSWLLENSRPDLKWRDFQGETALMVAIGRKDERIIKLLGEHGATE